MEMRLAGRLLQVTIARKPVEGVLVSSVALQKMNSEAQRTLGEM
jgi:hypothetical protein